MKINDGYKLPMSKRIKKHFKANFYFKYIFDTIIYIVHTFFN